ncbi:hypothetical protein DFA_03342 [Cavenderia fasciculata]|uniref:Uncharacterized protein n=1 Tax=Cavenderia fasciculata TaxID=261658 RepID=F4PHB2_CACFS|nr:uncharacterized protein DFA_03342 [Cavenderia fasciculata]EGG25096.1 hypothetical protein DFA_03342 [Cavenderia fasciculata]|eukprot:XP_004362947.1 hypothetical protein DFA_03342 [Cavenderia fasciculata]
MIRGITTTSSTYIEKEGGVREESDDRMAGVFGMGVLGMGENVLVWFPMHSCVDRIYVASISSNLSYYRLIPIMYLSMFQCLDNNNK